MKVSYPKGSYDLVAAAHVDGGDDVPRIIVKESKNRRDRDEAGCVYSLSQFSKKISESQSSVIDLIIQDQSFLLKLNGDDLAGVGIRNLHCHFEINALRQRFTLEGITAKKVVLGNIEVRMQNVTCELLECGSRRQNLHIIDCRIGILKFFSHNNGEGFGKIKIESSSILSFSLEKNLSFADFTLIETTFASTFEKWRQDSKQAETLRDFNGDLDRASMARLQKLAQSEGNSKLAHIARGYEVAFEVAEADRQEKPFFFLWGIAANYGLSLWTPLVWLAALVIGFALLLYVAGTELGVSQSEAFGWKQNLVGDSCSAQWNRAFAGAIEGLFSPFTVFSARRLVVPISGIVAVLQFFYSYICIALLFTFGFAVRRRFKVS